MGIPEFYGDYLKKGHQGIVVNSIPSGADVNILAIDTPGLIHKNAQKTWIYGSAMKNKRKAELKEEIDNLLKNGSEAAFSSFVNMIKNDIIEIVSMFGPKILILAIDGRAPMAKIQQQRKRRYGARGEITQEELERFDSAVISPGTEFMRRLDIELRMWIKQAQKPNEREIRDVKTDSCRKVKESVLPSHVIYSPYSVPGEAEQKIMDILTSDEIDANIIDSRNKSPTVNIIYGKDADLILLSMLIPQEKVSNIFVVRESYIDMVDINTFIKTLNSEGIHQRDFVTIMSFIGNDFLPRQSSLKVVKQSIDSIIKSYRETKSIVNEILSSEGDLPEFILTDDQGVIWENMMIFINKIAENEKNFLATVLVNKDSFREGRPLLLMESVEMIDGEPYFDYKKYRKIWYDNALGLRGSEEDIEFIKDLIPEAKFSYDEEDIDDMCEEYLKMFSWVHNYYTYSDMKWDMYYPYHHAPLLQDLSKFLNKTKKISELNDVVSEHPETKGNYNMLHQLMAILPPQSSNLVPANFRYLMGPYSYISDLYPEKIEIDKDATRSAMMFNFILPFADIDRIIGASYNSMQTIPLDDWKEYEGQIVYKQSKPCRLKRDRGYYSVRASSLTSVQSSEESGSRGSRRGESRGRGGVRDSRGRGSGRVRGGVRDNRGRGSVRARRRGGSQPSSSREIPEGTRRPLN